MDIILDSNIFRSDFHLRSKEFEVILDYLKKTDSAIVLPQIILDEIKGLYTKTIQERHSKLNSHVQNFNLIVMDTAKHVGISNIDFNEETEKYERFLIEKLQIRKSKIIPLKNEYLPEVVKRAISRTKPCGESGQGFRDSIIWLTLKDYCKQCHEKQVVFISNNDTDFGDSQSINLHSSLNLECEEENIKIHYFKTIKDFVTIHSTKIDYITDDWLANKFDDKWLEDTVLAEFKRKEPRRMISIFSRRTGHSCTENFRAIHVYPESIENLSVYEMIDNKLIVNVAYNCQVEIEFEIYEDQYYSHSDFPFTTLAHVTDHMPFMAYFSIKVADKEIEEIEINDLEF